MSLWTERLTRVIAEAGYGNKEPLIVGLDHQGHGPVFAAQGVTRTGEPLSSGTVTYTASLAKQMTAACVALLVQEGVLDIEAPLAKWLPELPAWAARVQLRHLLCHTAALRTNRSRPFWALPTARQRPSSPPSPKSPCWPAHLALSTPIRVPGTSAWPWPWSGQQGSHCLRSPREGYLLLWP